MSAAGQPPATPAGSPGPPPARSGSKSRLWWALGAIALLVAAIAIIWLVTKDDEDSGKVGPKFETQQQLSDLQKSLGHSIYWVGPRPGQQYELTKLNNGNVYIRYLPQGTEAGDARPAFLSVGTYPRPGVYEEMQQLAKKRGSISKRVQGGIAVSPANRRQSVYIAFPGSDYQIEVYDPSARTARRLAFSGQARPVS